MIKRTALLALALIGAASVAMASTPHAVDGAWSFKTATFQGDCVMTGRLIVKPSAKGAHACELIAYQTCSAYKITTKQTCQLSEQNGAVTIKSKIVHSTSTGYAPDDFALKLESAARMTGELRSADIAKVVFYRGDEVIS
jgi:hypothetical protein